MNRIIRVAERVAATRVTATTPARPWLMASLTIIILGISGFAIARSEISLESIRWPPLVGVLLISLTSPWLAAMEYRLGLRLAGGDTPWAPALQVSLYGSIANTLPLPAGFAIRLKAMTEQGVRIKKVLGASALIGLVWLTLSLLALGISVRSGLGVASLIAAGVMAVIAVAVVSAGNFPWRLLGSLVLLEALFVLSAAARFYLVLTGLNIAVSWLQALALSASGPIASAIGVIPGGLGVFEGVSAGIAALVGLTASVGLIASVLLRIAALLAILAWVPMVRVNSVEEPFIAETSGSSGEVDPPN